VNGRFIDMAVAIQLLLIFTCSAHVAASAKSAAA